MISEKEYYCNCTPCPGILRAPNRSIAIGKNIIFTALYCAQSCQVVRAEMVFRRAHLNYLNLVKYFNICQATPN